MKWRFGLKEENVVLLLSRCVEPTSSVMSIALSVPMGGKGWRRDWRKRQFSFGHYLGTAKRKGRKQICWFLCVETEGCPLLYPSFPIGANVLMIVRSVGGPYARFNLHILWWPCWTAWPVSECQSHLQVMRNGNRSGCISRSDRSLDGNNLRKNLWWFRIQLIL